MKHVLGIGQSTFARLIKVYTLIVSVMVFLATGLFVWGSIQTYRSEMRQSELSVENQIGLTVSQNQQIVSQFAARLGGSPDVLASLGKYFTSSPGDYSSYAIDRSLEGQPYFFWPTEARQFFVQNDFVTQLSLRLLDQKQVFVATSENAGGHLVSEAAVKQRFAVSAPLVNQYTLDTAGVISVNFDQSSLTTQLKQLTRSHPLQVAVLSSAHDPVYYFSSAGVPAAQKQAFQKAMNADDYQRLHGYRIVQRDLASGYQLVLIANQAATRSMQLTRVAPLVLLGSILLVGINAGLWLTFRRYEHQLDTIVATVAQVSKGDLNARVPLDLKPTDLRTLADGINTMLVEINQHIYTIYQLQIAQQKANMKALQAQINPHFMSNTLEYIRMAALEAGQPELANVVYSFAALLRNNIDVSPRTTLKDELNFIEKYVFLYQVRFPDRLAYQFSIDPSVQAIALPKFSLQPIVENYFVHGVDFSRQDNALSVKAWREADMVHIRIVNNGADLSPTELQALNIKMRQPLGDEQQQSIGLQNVYSRMRDAFGDDFDMQMLANLPHGVRVEFKFKIRKD